MSAVTRINITDPVLLRRIEIARERLDDTTSTKTAQRLLGAQLDSMQIPLVDVVSKKSKPRRSKTRAA